MKNVEKWQRADEEVQRDLPPGVKLVRTLRGHTDWIGRIAWSPRRAHFAQSRVLIDKYHGKEIKTIGDSFMAAFKSADAALDYATALQGNTGHQRIQIRAGIHIGPMSVEEDDVFGGTINFAARVAKHIEGAEIWVSDRAKKDIYQLGAVKHRQLCWERHDDVTMKGFQDVFTLWSVK